MQQGHCQGMHLGVRRLGLIAAPPKNILGQGGAGKDVDKVMVSKKEPKKERSHHFAGVARTSQCLSGFSDIVEDDPNPGPNPQQGLTNTDEAAIQARLLQIPIPQQGLDIHSTYWANQAHHHGATGMGANGIMGANGHSATNHRQVESRSANHDLGRIERHHYPILPNRSDDAAKNRNYGHHPYESHFDARMESHQETGPFSQLDQMSGTPSHVNPNHHHHVNPHHFFNDPPLHQGLRKNPLLDVNVATRQERIAYMRKMNRPGEGMTVAITTTGVPVAAVPANAVVVNGAILKHPLKSHTIGISHHQNPHTSAAPTIGCIGGAAGCHSAHRISIHIQDTPTKNNKVSLSGQGAPGNQKKKNQKRINDGHLIGDNTRGPESRLEIDILHTYNNITGIAPPGASRCCDNNPPLVCNRPPPLVGPPPGIQQRAPAAARNQRHRNDDTIVAPHTCAKARRAQANTEHHVSVLNMRLKQAGEYGMWEQKKRREERRQGTSAPLAAQQRLILLYTYYLARVCADNS